MKYLMKMRKAVFNILTLFLPAINLAMRIFIMHKMQICPVYVETLWKQKTKEYVVLLLRNKVLVECIM